MRPGKLAVLTAMVVFPVSPTPAFSDTVNHNDAVVCHPETDIPGAGTSQALNIAQEKASRRVKNAPPSAPSKLGARVPKRFDSTLARATFFSGLGLAGVGGASMDLAFKRAEDSAPGGEKSEQEDSTKWQGLMWAGLGTGAALMITGVVLWLADDVDQPTEMISLSAEPASAGMGMVLSLKWKW